MQVATLTTFRANKKEPLGDFVERLHAACLAGPGEPDIRFLLTDSPIPGGVSAIDRAVKRYPELGRFVSTGTVMLGSPPARNISNGLRAPLAGEQLPFATIYAIASGVPRSLPFHGVTLQFKSPVFGESDGLPGPMGNIQPGILVTDSWWVSGRMRSVAAYAVVSVEMDDAQLPGRPEQLDPVWAACGKVESTAQTPLLDGAAAGAREAVSAVIAAYRPRMPGILEAAQLPHDLPPSREALHSTPLGLATGPKKPVLMRSFKPMGYSCTAGSGTFTLRRRTPGNLTVEIDLDVGTWSRSLTAMFRVHGLGFSARMGLPVSKDAQTGQYPIGDADHWQKLVDNLAALVKELDRTFVPDVGAAAGPSPAWYTPET